MKRLFPVLLLLLLISAPAAAQKSTRDSVSFRRHIIGLSPGYAFKMVGLSHVVFIGPTYHIRFSKVYGLQVSALLGVNTRYGGFESRLFVDNKFNIWGERTVQPVFYLGAHIGSSANNFEYGLVQGAGVEFIFGKKRWMAGIAPRLVISFGLSSKVDMYVYLQPTIAYRI